MCNDRISANRKRPSAAHSEDVDGARPAFDVEFEHQHQHQHEHEHEHEIGDKERQSIKKRPVKGR